MTTKKAAIIDPNKAVLAVAALNELVVHAAKWAEDIADCIKAGKLEEAEEKARNMAEGMPQSFVEIVLQYTLPVDQTSPEVLALMEEARQEFEATGKSPVVTVHRVPRAILSKGSGTVH